MKRMLWMCMVLIVLLSACAGPKMTVAEQWQEQYDLGVRYLEEGNYEEAIIAFNAAIEIDPMNEETYFQLAQIHMAQKDYAAAEEILKQGIELTDSSRLKTLLEELQRSNELVSLLGKTMGDMVERYGSDYVAGSYAGSTCLFYEDIAGFDFCASIEYPDNNAVIHIIWANSSKPLIGNLTGNMTYPEILDAVGEEVSLEPPEYYYNLEVDDDAYSIGFEYQGYYIIYEWFEDPETHASAYARITEIADSLEFTTYEPDMEMIEERFKRVGRNYLAEVLSIPDEAEYQLGNIRYNYSPWWEMGCYAPTDNGPWLYASFKFNPWTDEATITPEWGGDFGAEFKISEYDY